MNRYSTVPEYTLETSEKTRPMGKVPHSLILDYQALEAELVLLHREFGMVSGILESIRDSIDELVLSVRER